MAVDGDGDAAEKSTFRWLDGVRYAVASVVTVLIFTVIGIAVKMVLRPDLLYLSVIGGSVSVSRNETALFFDFTLMVDNPSGRVHAYYNNITGYLFNDNMSALVSSSDPTKDCFEAFKMGDKALKQQDTLYSFTHVSGTRKFMTPPYFDLLYNNQSARMENATMRIDGYLITRPVSWRNATVGWVNYTCAPLVVGWIPKSDDEDSTNTKTITCQLM